MNYQPIFSIRLKHSFYENQKSDDFQLVPTEGCQKLLSGHRLLWKPRFSAWQMVGQIQDGKPWLDIKDNALFRFYLKVSNPSILNVTSFSIDQESIETEEILSGHVYLRYAIDEFDDSFTLSQEYFYQTDSFTVSCPRKADVFFLKRRALENFSIHDFEIAGLDAVTHIDEYDEASKTIVLDTSESSIGTSFSVTYRTKSSWPAGVIGMVEVSLQDYEKLDQILNLHLYPKKAKWKYYLASDIAFETLQLIECNDTETLKFEKKDLKTESGTDPLKSWIERKFPDAASLVLFITENEVMFREGLNADLNLLSDDTTLNSSLPVPSRDRLPFQILTHFSTNQKP